jgi:hypothetical protein
MISNSFEKAGIYILAEVKVQELAFRYHFVLISLLVITNR